MVTMMQSEAMYQIPKEYPISKDTFNRDSKSETSKSCKKGSVTFDSAFWEDFWIYRLLIIFANSLNSDQDRTDKPLVLFSIQTIWH